MAVQVFVRSVRNQLCQVLTKRHIDSRFLTRQAQKYRDRFGLDGNTFVNILPKICGGRVD